MSSKSISRINIILPILISIVAFTLCGLLLNMHHKDQQKKEKELATIICQEKDEKVNLQSFFTYSCRMNNIRNNEMVLKNEDLFKLYDAEYYSDIHLSMWDISMLTPEWYEQYFANPILYTSYKIKTPQELRDYLTNCFIANANLSYVCMNLDPYLLMQNYYEYIYYDSEILTFEEYITDNIFPFFEEHPNVRFDIFFPTMPISFWRDLSSEEHKEIIDTWYTFLIYLRWWSNVRVAYTGTVEWFVTNETNFVTTNECVEEVALLDYIYLYGYEEYTITPPELEQEDARIQELVERVNAGEYDYSVFSDKTFVFYGDSVFAYAAQPTLSVPGCIKNMTGAECFDYSEGGTTASEDFVIVAGNSAGREANRIIQDDTDGKDYIYVIEYGLNDYFTGCTIDEYRDGLCEGISAIREKHPKAEIVIVSPYTVVEGDYGTKKIDMGSVLADYAHASEWAAGKMKTTYVNAYAKMEITPETESHYLIDGTHLNYETNIWFAKMILDGINSR